MKQRWRIEGWTGQVLFGGRTFGSFEEGWEFIYVEDPEPEETDPRWLDHWYDDYYVVSITKGSDND